MQEQGNPFALGKCRKSRLGDSNLLSENISCAGLNQTDSDSNKKQKKNSSKACKAPLLGKTPIRTQEFRASKEFRLTANLVLNI